MYMPDPIIRDGYTTENVYDSSEEDDFRCREDNAALSVNSHNLNNIYFKTCFTFLPVSIKFSLQDVIHISWIPDFVCLVYILRFIAGLIIFIFRTTGYTKIEHVFCL